MKNDLPIMQHNTPGLSVELYEGDDYAPWRLRVRFKDSYWIGMKIDTRYGLPLSDNEHAKLSVRHAIETFVYGLRREIENALPPDLR